MNFDEAFEKLIDPDHEGGFQNDPRDKGNWTGGAIHSGKLKGTKYGISAASYPNIDIEALSKSGAKAIYLRDFWNKVISDDIPQNIHFAMFDMAVNSGPKYAIKVLQKALCVEPDGEIGPKTIAALRNEPASLLVNRINAHRLLDMTNMSGWTDYGRGWARRIAKNVIDDNTI